MYSRILDAIQASEGKIEVASAAYEVTAFPQSPSAHPILSLNEYFNTCDITRYMIKIGLLLCQVHKQYVAFLERKHTPNVWQALVTPRTKEMYMRNLE